MAARRLARPPPPALKKLHLLPTLLTLGNAFCGLMAISKAVDGLAYPELFYGKLETACWLVLLGMVFDALDGTVARMTNTKSSFGAQLDSFSDALTFGVAPAILAKVLIEHEGALRDYAGHPRLHFLAAAAFSMMAILRLVRFNLESDTEGEAHGWFRGLPSPAAGGAVVSTILVYLLPRAELQMEEGMPTPVGTGMSWLRGDFAGVQSWMLPLLAVMLPLLGLLMVSRLKYVHVFFALTRGRITFFTLVLVVFAALVLRAAPEPVLFVAFNGFVVYGVVRALVHARRVSLRRAEQGS